jgi:hypothetical protein
LVQTYGPRTAWRGASSGSGRRQEINERRL